MSNHDNISRVYTARNSRSLKLGNTAFTPKMKMSGLRNHRLNIHHLYATDGKAGYFFVTSLFYSGMIWVYRMYSTGGPNVSLSIVICGTAERDIFPLTRWQWKNTIMLSTLYWEIFLLRKKSRSTFLIHILK